MTYKSFPVVMYAASVGCGLLSITVLPWAYYASSGIPLWFFPGWKVLPIGMLALFGSVALALFSRHRTSRIAIAGVVLSAAFTGAYAAVLISRYDDRGSFFGGPTNLVVAFPGPGGPFALLAVLLGTTAVVSAYRRARGDVTQTRTTLLTHR